MRIANSTNISDDCFGVVRTSSSSSGKYETASMKRSLDAVSTHESQPHTLWFAASEASSSSSSATSALRNDIDERARTSHTPHVLQHQCPEPECGRRFNRKYTLVEHMKTHTGEKPHVCPVRSCGKRFSTSGNLSRHKRLHGFIQPIECPVDGCACTFSSENKLEKHMKFHSGSPVHVCQIESCGKTFSTIGNLNRHAKNQHADVLASSASLPEVSTALDALPLESSQHAYQLDDLASILHEEIDFVEPTPSDAAAPTTATAATPLSFTEALGGSSSSSCSDESECDPESPNRKRRRTILDDMINFHVAHFGS